MKKIAPILVLIIVFVAMMPAVQAQDNVTLKVWTDVFPGDGIQHVVEAFEATHPNINVEWEEYVWNDAQWNLLLTTAAASGDLPDVIVSPSHAIIWSIEGFIQPVTDLAEADSDLDLSMWDEGALSLALFNDEVYALPFSTSAMLLYYNRDMMEEAGIDPDDPPESWSELIEYAEKTDVTDSNRLQRVGYVADFGGITRLTLYMYGNGGRFFTEDCMQPALNDPANVEALEWYIMTYDRLGGAEKVLAFVEGVGGEAGAAFYSGRVAMYAAQNDFAALIRANSPDLNWGVWPHPTNDDVPYMTLGGGDQVMMPVGTEHREEAWELMKFFATDYDANVQWVRDTNLLSLVPGISQEFADDPALSLALELIQGSMQPWVYNPIGLFMSVERSTATDLALRHVMSAQEALDEAQQNSVDAYARILDDLADQGITDIKMRCY